MNASNISRRGALRALAAGSVAMTTPAAAIGSNDPIFLAIETHRKLSAAVRVASEESMRLHKLATAGAGECKVMIPDLRGPNAADDDWLPVAYEQDGLSYVEARSIAHIDEYLPGKENEGLRQCYQDKLASIEAAHAQYWPDEDEDAFSDLCSAECAAGDRLFETVPTTLPGLFALLIYMAEAHSYDAEVMAEHHIEPLILGLGAAARTLSGAVQS